MCQRLNAVIPQHQEVMLRPHTVRSHPKPRHPTRMEEAVHGGLLLDNIPPRWRDRATMRLLLTVLLSNGTVIMSFDHGTTEGEPAPPAVLSEEGRLIVLMEAWHRAGRDASTNTTKQATGTWPSTPEQCESWDSLSAGRPDSTRPSMDPPIMLLRMHVDDFIEWLRAQGML